SCSTVSTRASPGCSGGTATRRWNTRRCSLMRSTRHAAADSTPTPCASPGCGSPSFSSPSRSHQSPIASLLAPARRRTSARGGTFSALSSDVAGCCGVDGARLPPTIDAISTRGGTSTTGASCRNSATRSSIPHGRSQSAESPARGWCHRARAAGDGRAPSIRRSQSSATPARSRSSTTVLRRSGVSVLAPSAGHAGACNEIGSSSVTGGHGGGRRPLRGGLGLPSGVETFAATRGLAQDRAVLSQLDQGSARLSLSRRDAIDFPIRPQELHDLAVVVGQGESARRRDVRLPLREVFGERRRPGHLETEHDGCQRLDIARVEIEMGLYDVAIERHVQGLILCDPAQRLRESWIILLTHPRAAEV